MIDNALNDNSSNNLNNNFQSIGNSDNNSNGKISPPNSPDMSKSTIIALVLLTLLISVIGTWTVLNEISSVKVSQQTSSGSHGNVQLEVLSAHQNPKSDAISGQVSLIVNK